MLLFSFSLLLYIVIILYNALPWSNGTGLYVALTIQDLYHFLYCTEVAAVAVVEVILAIDVATCDAALLMFQFVIHFTCQAQVFLLIATGIESECDDGTSKCAARAL